ncbi:ExbD/TolR family protein [Psychromonas sp.]|uniref:ExbD/TolR family protein n=1 Tax=Psychromonas sp. TaxID=1884585 RepID=UPI003568844F
MLLPEKTNNQTQSDDNLIPLINVVFLMLIFFMVAGQIQRSDPQKISLPDSISELTLQKQKENRVELLVTESGTLYIDGVLIPISELKERLMVHFAQAKEPQHFNVLLKVDANLEVQRLQEILTGIKMAGLLHISLITQKIEA